MSGATALTPQQRTLRARLAAQTRWAQQDPVAGTEAARRAFTDRFFVDQVDPDRVLPERERHRRAESARKAFYTQMAYRSAQVRARRRGGSDAA